MTSEVVVMNRIGIALASDSAASVHIGGRTKVYHANKLFMLSNHHPVGVMIYNNSSLLGVPWETILKMFRARLGARSFATLGEYTQELLAFLSDNRHLFPLEIQRRYFLLLVDKLYESINANVTAEFVRRSRATDGTEPVNEVEVLNEVVDSCLVDWRKKNDICQTCFGIDDVGGQLVGQASKEISNLVFKAFPTADAGLVTKLYELAKLVVNKEEILVESLSGIVIAGFGDDEFFPTMDQIELGEIFLDKPKFNRIETLCISADTPSVIKPFAQSDVVLTFLNGISPAFEQKVVTELAKIMLKVPQEVIDAMPGVSRQRKLAYQEKVDEVSEEAIVSVICKLLDFKERKHLQPILQSIEFLPKDELAHAASSLVNLSSFQKRMSTTEDETVGGPIDVAVISKGDGFVWIDRKHYFKPEFNQHYFRNKNIDAKSETYGEINGDPQEGDD
jgi:hypothetical protein